MSDGMLLFVGSAVIVMAYLNRGSSLYVFKKAMVIITW